MSYKYTCNPNVSCDHCGQRFYKLPCKMTTFNYCSNGCRSAAAMEDRTCETCGKSFVVQRHKRRRFCSRACSKNTKHSMPPFETRFWSKVDKSGGDDACWLWTPPAHRYGRIKRDGVFIGSHRVSWELANGPIPDGFFVCHSCDNPICVNPAHLFLGSPAENSADAVNKGRHAHGETASKTKLTEDQVREIRKRYVPKYGALIEIAREFGVAPSTIQSIINRSNWKHVD